MNFIKLTWRLLVGSLASAALLAASTAPAMAQDQFIVVEQERATCN